MLNLSILNWYSHPSYNVLQPIRHVSILFQGKVLRNFVCFVFHVSLYVALTVKSINSPPYPLFLYIIFASESNLNIFSSVIQVINGLLQYWFSVCNLPSCMPCLSTCLFHKKLWNDTTLDWLSLWFPSEKTFLSMICLTCQTTKLHSLA